MEGHGVEDVWSTEQMRENRHNWSLAADTSLLSYIQQFSQNLLNETHKTLKSLDSLESDLNTACVGANTVANKFLSLADTQFVENRVYDDEETSTPGDASDFTKKNLDDDKENVIAGHIKEALMNGLQVVSTKFKVVEIPDSDSEEDESLARSGMVLKPINPYQDRVLPHLIGSIEFNHDDTLGLRESQSDEETEEAVSMNDKAESETEDSEPESDQTKAQESNGPMDGFRNGVSFSEQLAARLDGVGHQENNLKNMNVPVEEDDSDSLFFGESRSSEDKEDKRKNLFSDEQSPDLWKDSTDEDSKLFTKDKSLLVENLVRSSQVHQDTLHSKYNNSSSTHNTESKRTAKPESLFDDTDQGSDLFHDVHQPDTVKKKMPPGAVSIFGADVDLFGEKAVPFLSASGSDKTIGTRPRVESKIRVSVSKSENQADDVLAIRSSAMTRSKSSDSVPQAKEEDDYDDLFSSTQINNTKKSSKEKSEVSVASKPRNTVNHDDMFSNGNDFLSSKTSLFGNKKTLLFESPDDDLFSGDDIFPSNSSKKPFKLFDEENLFDDNKTSDLFNDNKQSDLFDDNRKSSLFDDNKKSDLFDDLFVSSDTTFNDNNIHHNEDLFKNRNSQVMNKNDKSSDNKVFSNSGTVDYTIKENSDDLFSYSELSNSNSVKNSEGGLPKKHFDSEDTFARNLLGVRKSSTENLFKGYSSSHVSDNENIFSHTSAGKPQGLFIGSTVNTLQSSKETSATQSIFNETSEGSDNYDIFSNLGSHNRLTSEHSKAPSSLFTNSLSNSSSFKRVEKIDVNHSNSVESSNSNKKASNIKKLQNSPDLFGEEDEDDLFKTGTSKKLVSKNKENFPHQASKMHDNNNVCSTKTGSEESDIKNLFVDDSDDLFGTGTLNLSGHNSLLGTKTVSATAKSKKLHGTCPLFDDSDSDDDLFSSPRGSLGSKKSQSSVNLSQDINLVLKKNLLEDAPVRKQNESMEYDLFKALKNTSKNNYLFADIISDDEGNDNGDLFSALKPSDAKQKISGAEKIDKHNITTNEISSSAKSEKNANESLHKGRTAKQLEQLTISSVKTEFRRDSGDSLVTENALSPGKLNSDLLPKINPATLLPGMQPRIITSPSKTLKTEQNLFPSGDKISTLQNIVKDRPKIQVKRRLPSRRARQEALRVLASDEHDISSKAATAHEDNSRVGDGSTIMSPSTDEEDMFGVPPLETKISSSPTDIFSESAIVLPGQSSIFTTQHSEFVTTTHSSVDRKQTTTLEFEHEIVPFKKLALRDGLPDNLSGVVRVDFDDKLFESNLKDTNQSNDSTGVNCTSTEDFLSSDSNITKSCIPTDKPLSADSSGNISTPVSADKDKPSFITKLKSSAPKVSHDFFDDSDSVSENLFSSNLESKPKAKLPNKKSLFDDDNEDDDIFCTSVSASSSKTADTVQKKSIESGSSKTNTFPKRPVKLASQQAFTDPLMSSGD